MASTTVRGIASSLGLSPATVSRSLNNSPDVSSEVRAKVLAEARRLGYAPVRKGPKTGRIGLIFLNETSGPKFSGYDAIIWGGVTRAAMSLQYDVCIVNPQEKRADETFAGFAARKGVDGFIVRLDADTRHVGPQFAADGVPHVIVADRFEEPDVNYVCCNSTLPSRQAIEHLLHLGHRRIGVCHNAILDTDHRDRIEAYRAVLGEAGLPIDDALMVAIHAEIGGGAAALNRLLSLPEPPTAIFVTDPALTVGILLRALEVGVRIPQELSVIGVDDERLRKMTHPIYTAVCQNAMELAHQAGRWLCRQLSDRNGRDGSQPGALRMEMEAFLEINQTTAPPPARPVRVTPTGQRLEDTTHSAGPKGRE